MALAKFWAGKAYGTNTGNLFVNLEGEDAALTGTLRLSDDRFGLVQYSIEAKFDGSALTITGKTTAAPDGITTGDLKAKATVNPKGHLDGEWETTLGSAGTFTLFPHERPQGEAGGPIQLHTARHNFEPVIIDRTQITDIAEQLKKDFPSGTVAITFTCETEQSRFLEDFKQLKISEQRARVIKIYAQEPEPNEILRTVTIEFGPQGNWAVTQSSDESWAIGKLEMLKRELHSYERSYATNIKRLGFGINQLLLLFALIYLPGLKTLLGRLLFMIGIVAITRTITWLHNKYLPVAVIYLAPRPKGLLARMGPSLLSWFIAATAAAAATLLATYLQDVLDHLGHVGQNLSTTPPTKP